MSRCLRYRRSSKLCLLSFLFLSLRAAKAPDSFATWGFGDGRWRVMIENDNAGEYHHHVLILPSLSLPSSLSSLSSSPLYLLPSPVFMFLKLFSLRRYRSCVASKNTFYTNEFEKRGRDRRSLDLTVGSCCLPDDRNIVNAISNNFFVRVGRTRPFISTWTVGFIQGWKQLENNTFFIIISHRFVLDSRRSPSKPLEHPELWPLYP